MSWMLLALLVPDTSRPARDLLGPKWEKWHASASADTWDVTISGRAITWFRQAGGDGGSAGVRQDVKFEARRLRLELEVRVDEHALPGSGWWSDHHGGTGEYPVKIEIGEWTHGFLTRDNPDRLRNYTKVTAGEWVRVKLDIDFGKVVSVTSIRLYGAGWSFRGGVRNFRLIRS